jgi:hypothetical protein
MAVIVTATIAAADANSYVTAVEADAYMANRLNVTAWTAATADQRAQALIMACRAIGRLRIRCHRPARAGVFGNVSYYDEYAPYRDTQALPFPRVADVNASGAVIIPLPVKDAQCEEALAVLAMGDDATRRATLQAQGVTSFSVPGLSETYKAGARGTALVSAEALALLAPYIDSTAVIATSSSPYGELTPGSAM